MTTIGELLDRYGQPPAEVAMDWAWQIRRRELRRQVSHNATSDCCLLEVDQWTQIELSEDGQLMCEQLHPDAVRSALDDLRVWAGTEPIGTSRRSAQSTDLTESDPFATSDQSCVTATSKPIRTALTSRRSSGWATRPTSRWVIGVTMVLLSTGVMLMLFWPTARKSSPAGGTSMGSDVPHAAMVEHRESEPFDASQVPQLETIELDKLPVDIHTSVDDWSVPPSSPAVGQLSVAASLDSTEAPKLSLDAAATDGQRKTNGMDDSSADASGSDAVDEVERALKKAEAAESVTLVGSGAEDRQETHGKPWELLRDKLRYRVNGPPKLKLTRQAQWTLAIEPITGLALEPEGPVTLSAQGLATWRIYETESKSPRACLVVRARHHGRDNSLELVFCGGSEDMPNLSVPLAQRWLGPLTVSMEYQAVQLRAALARLTKTVITPEQVPIVLQRKQAMMSQMLVSTRLVAIMPDINRLAELADGQITMHAELRSKPGESPIAAWGRVVERE